MIYTILLKVYYLKTKKISGKFYNKIGIRGKEDLFERF